MFLLFPKKINNNEWQAKKTSEILDNKSLERTMKTQDEEIDRLQKELKE